MDQGRGAFVLWQIGRGNKVENAARRLIKWPFRLRGLAGGSSVSVFHMWTGIIYALAIQRCCPGESDNSTFSVPSGAGLT